MNNKIIVKAVEYNFATNEFKITLFNETFNEYYTTTAPANLFYSIQIPYDYDEDYFIKVED